MCACTCSVAELNLGKFLSCLNHIALVAEAVGKNDFAAVVSKVCSCFVARVVLADIGLENDLIVGELELFLYGVGSLHKVVVVGGVLIVKENETDFEVLGDSGLFGGILFLCLCSRSVLVLSRCARLSTSGKCKYHYTSQ